MINHKVKQFNKLNLAVTKNFWEKKAGKEEFASEYGVIFDWVSAHSDYSNGVNVGDSLAYGLFKPNTKYASAIVDVVSSRRGRFGVTKLLKVYITPEFWNVSEHIDEIINIYLSAISGTISLSKQNSARTIKIYGRSVELLSLLHSIHVHISARQSTVQNIAASMHGRWLEITVK